jgi:hypothetical protein
LVPEKETVPEPARVTVFPEALLARTGELTESRVFVVGRESVEAVPAKLRVPPPMVSVAEAALENVIPPSQTPVLVTVTVAEAFVKTAVLLEPLVLLQG